MDLQFSGASAAFQRVVGQARDRFEGIITGDLPDAILNEDQRPTPCGQASREIDDIEICIVVEELPKNILGVGGVRLVRSNAEGTLLPVTGQIGIDRSAHENNPGRLRATTVSESMHTSTGISLLLSSNNPFDTLLNNWTLRNTRCFML